MPSFEIKSNSFLGECLEKYQQRLFDTVRIHSQRGADMFQLPWWSGRQLTYWCVRCTRNIQRKGIMNILTPFFWTGNNGNDNSFNCLRLVKVPLLSGDVCGVRTWCGSILCFLVHTPIFMVYITLYWRRTCTPARRRIDAKRTRRRPVDSMAAPSTYLSNHA